MSEREPLPGDLEKLLDAERSYPAESGERQARVKAAVVTAIAVATPIAAATHIATGKAAATAAAAKTGLSLGATLSIAAATFVAGGLAGVAVERNLASHAPVERAQPETRATIATPDVQLGDAAQESPIPEEPPAQLIIPIAPEPAQVPRTAPASHPRAEVTHAPEADEVIAPPLEARAATLAREREIIDVARAALVHGHADGALQALERHRVQFPAGQLAEERDALRVQALARFGRVEQAHSAARQFHANYPTSLFAPAVDAAVARARAIP
ncbi:MAG: hypothetical protein IPK60_09530 [Sandaracinaceae bacterium]|jgi:hypothetical protein|nr:hypothetical protein [Sandaracinaceae bacterium]